MVAKLIPVGGRKVVLFLMVFAVVTALLWFGKVTNENWVDVTKWSFGFLVAGNVGEHIAKRNSN